VYEARRPSRIAPVLVTGENVREVYTIEQPRLTGVWLRRRMKPAFDAALDQIISREVPGDS
jgi:hypothetical protein